MSISILIPTFNRYRYLNVLLEQLNNQTIFPLEVIIIDQTAVLERKKITQENYPRLNLEVLKSRVIF